MGPPVQPGRTRGAAVSTNRGTRPLFAPEDEAQIVETVQQSEPHALGLPGRGWTLKKLRAWIAQKWGHTVSRGALRRILAAAGLTWKKCKKLLGKADPQKRAEYLERFLALYDRMRRGEVLLIYVDESHFHRDLDLGYTWSPCGQRAWRVSDCPGLAERINWYGAYNFTAGTCLIWNEGNCNKEHTAQFLERIQQWIGLTQRQVIIIWDGAPWHRAAWVRQQAEQLGIELVLLPSYSPDLNPIEGLWKWMREEVTQHCCHDSLRGLFDACKQFVDGLNQDPLAVINRLWPRFELDPEVEKLRLPK